MVFCFKFLSSISCCNLFWNLSFDKSCSIKRLTKEKEQKISDSPKEGKAQREERKRMRVYIHLVK